MQFIVPQFIDIEPKIIGPITPRQFVTFIVVGFLVFVTYKLANFVYFILLSIFYITVGVILAFAKVNGRPIHWFIIALLQTAKKPKIRIWRKEVLQEKVISFKEKKTTPLPAGPKRQLPKTKLSDLSLLVDTGGVYREEEIL
jgi:hypothetical protein